MPRPGSRCTGGFTGVTESESVEGTKPVDTPVFSFGGTWLKVKWNQRFPTISLLKDGFKSLLIQELLVLMVNCVY